MAVLGGLLRGGTLEASTLIGQNGSSSFLPVLRKAVVGSSSGAAGVPAIVASNASDCIAGEIKAGQAGFVPPSPPRPEWPTLHNGQVSYNVR